MYLSGVLSSNNKDVLLTVRRNQEVLSMNAAFKKELIKVGILIGIGVLFLIAFIIYALFTHQYDPSKHYSANFWGYFVLVGIVCYPLGIVYGWRLMLNLFLHLRGTDRAAYMEHPSLIYTMVNFGFSIFLTFFFGWVFGVIAAAMTLVRLRRA